MQSEETLGLLSQILTIITTWDTQLFKAWIKSPAKNQSLHGKFHWVPSAYRGSLMNLYLGIYIYKMKTINSFKEEQAEGSRGGNWALAHPLYPPPPKYPSTISSPPICDPCFNCTPFYPFHSPLLTNFLTSLPGCYQTFLMYEQQISWITCLFTLVSYTNSILL